MIICVSYRFRGGVFGDETALEQFFIWLAHNRSIEIFSAYIITFSEQDNFSIMAPFFEHNCNLRCIELKNADVSICILTLVLAISRTKMNRLARIDLWHTGIGDKNAADLINALNAMCGLSNLLDLWLCGNRIGKNGCLALFSLLKNPECRILSLDLSSNLFDDVDITILIDGLVVPNALKCSSIGDQLRLTAAGWKILSNFLSGTRCALEKIILYHVADDSAAALGDALARNENLKCLDFSWNCITPTGWREISNFLAPTSSILELNLNESNINDGDAFVLFSALAINATLKKLLLYSEHITSAGWVSCFRKLIGSRSVLIDIEFGRHIDDEGIAALATLVAGYMNTISSIDLWGEPSTSASWSVFANILVPSSTSKLKTLRVGACQDEFTGGHPITNDVVIDLVTALAGNSTLEVLDLNHVDDYVDSALERLIGVLCDTSSVDSICQSNHTLREFVCNSSDDTVGPSELRSLLEMNEDEDKALVVRKKLLTYFFSDVDNIGPVFGRMATTILPNAMEWIGRDRLGYSAMFEFCRSVPALFK